MIDSQAAVFRGTVIALSDIKEDIRIGEPVSIRIDMHAVTCLPDADPLRVSDPPPGRKSHV